MAIQASVSVIIPAYQAARTIGRALASIAAQNVLPSEIIIVDDGSDDGTLEIAEQMRGTLKGIDLTLLRQAHKGAGAARNKGINATNSFYVAFLDADDEWLPEKLARSLEVMAQTNSVLVSHNYIMQDSAGHESIVTKCDENYLAPGDPYVNLYKKGYIATSAVVAQRDAILGAGGFDETLPTAQDFALWLSMLHRPETPFCIFKDVLIRYHVTPGSITSHTERRLQCCLKIATNFKPRLAKRCRYPLFALWYRILSIHYEAATVYMEQKRLFAAFGVVIRLPFNLIKLTLISPQHGTPHAK